MEKIRVKKEELLSIVKENRDKHKKEYSEAIKAYRVKAGDLMTKELNKILSGEPFSPYFELVKPESHEREYNLAIKMLEMSVDDNIEIEQNEFNELVNDEWTWKRNFKSALFSNSSYYNLSSVGDKEITFPEDEIL